MPDNHLSSLKMMIECLLKSDFFFGLYCEGSTGIGKTTIVSNILTEQRIPFVTLSSYSTPLNFYNCLYENRDKVVLLDDCKGVIENPSIGISLIKAALSPCGHTSVGEVTKGKSIGKRILRWGSTTNKATVPEFEFQGRLIILSNTPPVQGEDGAAFRNRCLSFNIVLDPDQRMEMLSLAAKSQAERSVFEFLKENAQNISVETLNYRTLFVGASLYKTNRKNWKNLFLLTLPEAKTNPLKIVRQLAELELPIEQQYCRFYALTQRSRRTFFRYREECGLRKNGQILRD